MITFDSKPPSAFKPNSPDPESDCKPLIEEAATIPNEAISEENSSRMV